MYFANLNFTILDFLADEVKMALDMFELLVRPWFISIGNGTIVVTVDNQWVQCTWNSHLVQ